MPYRDTHGFEPEPDSAHVYPECMKVFERLEEIVGEDIHTVQVSTFVYKQVALACHYGQGQFYKVSAYFDQPSLTLRSLRASKDYRVVHNGELTGWNTKPMPVQTRTFLDWFRNV